jgi:protein tyrosine/serine phosphatase
MKLRLRKRSAKHQLSNSEALVTNKNEGIILRGFRQNKMQNPLNKGLVSVLQIVVEKYAPIWVCRREGH